MSEQDIYNALLEIKEDIGSIKSTTADTKEALVAHITKTECLAESVQELQLAQATHKGAARAYSAIGGVLGALLGSGLAFLADYLRH